MRLPSWKDFWPEMKAESGNLMTVGSPKGVKFALWYEGLPLCIMPCIIDEFTFVRAPPTLNTVFLEGVIPLLFE